MADYHWAHMSIHRGPEKATSSDEEEGGGGGGERGGSRTQPGRARPCAPCVLRSPRPADVDSCCGSGC
eukprot:2314360-Prymnesium_polylepis.2